MAKKQVIWSGSAKKDLYAAIESHLKKSGDRKLTSLFFDTVERKIQLLRKRKLLVNNTSVRNIYSFSEGSWYFLFEEKEESFQIHCVTE